MDDETRKQVLVAWQQRKQEEYSIPLSRNESLLALSLTFRRCCSPASSAATLMDTHSSSGVDTL